MMIDTSRKSEDLHPQLQEAWEYLRDKWESEYPSGPKVGLSCTYRGPIDQQAAYSTGTSRLKFGQSLHNYKPAFAFDVYFYRGKTADWSFKWFEKFAVFAEEIGLEWGGRWDGLVDGPHFQFKEATPKEAQAGIVRNPVLIPKPVKEEDSIFISHTGVEVPGENSGWKLVIFVNRVEQYAVDIPIGADVVTRTSPLSKRVYVDVRVG